MIELICVRHGRTAWNAERRFQGQKDVPLDETGHAQARSLAQALRAERIDAAVSSDLARAAETARAILTYHPYVPLRFDPDLREMAFGDWEGLQWAEIRASDPTLPAEGWNRPKLHVPPGGESFGEVVGRAGRAVRRLAGALPEGGRAVVATHAGVLHALLRVVLGEAAADALQVTFSPASTTRFALETDGSGRLIALNVGAPPARLRSLPNKE